MAVKDCCCGISLQIGGYLIAAFHLVPIINKAASLIFLIVGVVLLSIKNFPGFVPGNTPDVYGGNKVAVLIFSIPAIIANIVLLIGVIQKRGGFLHFWVLFSLVESSLIFATYAIMSIVEMVHNSSVLVQVQIILFLILCFAIELYFVAVIKSLKEVYIAEKIKRRQVDTVKTQPTQKK